LVKIFYRRPIGSILGLSEFVVPGTGTQQLRLEWQNALARIDDCRTIDDGPSTMNDSRSGGLSGNPSPDWKTHGLRIIRSGELDANTPQTPGMTRAEAISRARVGAQKLWAGTVLVHPNAKTGPHHHGELETVIYVVRGRARFRWGDHLEFVDEAGPGDFVYVPPYVPHQELNARKDQPVEAVIVRSGQEPIVINLDIPSPEDAPEAPQGDAPQDDSTQDDPFHSAPRKP
jgi:uncharacterized RmlC-like cupin family protein